MNKIKEVLFENKGFKINPMQEESAKLKGKGVIINAPTGAGKTEAILLNMKQGGHYLYFLPTITSCLFMFNRLKELKLLNLNVLTSVRTESFKLDDNYNSGTISICCPDNPLIAYFNGGEKFEKYDGLILDEIDSYPEMVKSCLIEILKESTKLHFIVASATIDKDLAKVFENRIKNKINYVPFKNDFTKFKIEGLGFGSKSVREEILEILSKNKNKKIGFIMNDIAYVEELESIIKSHNYHELEEDEEKIDFIILHGDMDEYDKSTSIEKMQNMEKGVVVSNDAITYSIDINFDILFVQSPDDQHVMIQRLGRCNRNNAPLEEGCNPNVYILECDERIGYRCKTSRHIDEDESYEIYCEYKDKSLFSFYDIEEIRAELSSIPLPSFEEDVLEHWEYQEENGMVKSLRDTCVKMVLPVTKKITNKKGEEEIINTVRILKSYGYGYPYTWKPYNANYEKVYVHFKGTTYEIVEGEDSRGDCLIREPRWNEIDDYYESDFDEDGNLIQQDDDEDDYDDDDIYGINDNPDAIYDYN